MKIRSISVAALAVLPLAVAGCAQEQAAPPPPSQEAPAENQQDKQADGVAWVDQMCGHVANFALSQQNAPQVDKSSIPKFKESSLAQVRAAEQAANDSLTGLQQMPESPIPGGNKVSDSFAAGFTEVRDILGTAKAKGEKVDTSNEQAFTEGMLAVQEELKKGESLNFEAQFAEFTNNPELAAAAEQAPQCKQFTQQPPQQGQPQPVPGQPQQPAPGQPQPAPGQPQQAPQPQG